MSADTKVAITSVTGMMLKYPLVVVRIYFPQCLFSDISFLLKTNQRSFYFISQHKEQQPLAEQCLSPPNWWVFSSPPYVSSA